MSDSAKIRFSVSDSQEMAAARRRELDIPIGTAAELGRSAVDIARQGRYLLSDGREISIAQAMVDALASRISMPPDEVLDFESAGSGIGLPIEVSNETTLGAARRLVDAGLRPLALNFANGVQPGGGFLHGALAQEEVLCRSSGLYLTLENDPMYEVHRRRPEPDSTDWAILSPDVPVFRSDAGDPLEVPWKLSFLTCAAPYAPAIGQPRSGDLLQWRIVRVLEIAASKGFRHLVLGAWGCGAFRNDPRRTAADFHEALLGRFSGQFDRVIFAICDWSPERRFLGPFREVFESTFLPESS